MLLTIFLYIYDILWCFSLPWVLLHLYFRGRKSPVYRRRLKERFGFAVLPKSVDVWIHAVSLGEVMAASSIIDACLQKGYCVLVTSMTPTGSEQIQKSWGDKVIHQYAPYDLSFFVRRFLNAYQPKMFIVLETELWPGILSKCYQRQIPVVLANARISNRSYPRYLKTRWFWKKLMGYFEMIYVQSKKDYLRFLSLGAHDSQLEIAGNLKFQSLPASSTRLQFWQEFKKTWGNKKIIVAGSTHPGEEKAILSIWRALHKALPNTVLCLVPRHPERFDEVCALIEGHSGQRFSAYDANLACDILLIDVMGELSTLYAIADCAFVGGSLVPIGGHNVLEPLTFGVPVIVGPHTFNQHDLIAILKEHQAMVEVHSAKDLKDAIIKILSDAFFCETLIQNGLETLASYQGTLNIHMKSILKNLDSVSL